MLSSALILTSGLAVGLIIVCTQIQNVASDGEDRYKVALSKSLLYFEAQRSGKLPLDQRVKWRKDSALNDGKDVGVDLVGGYYDAGDNVKFGFPMAYAMTMLSWGVSEYPQQLQFEGDLSNALEAIRWGMDYLIKAHSEPNMLYGQVGDGGSDHACWQRPEEMTTPRTAYKIDQQHPGSDLAGETAAAFAAASIAFQRSDPAYSAKLLTHAKQLYEFAISYTGLYQNSITSAGGFYASSGYEDELVWSAAWLHLATKDPKYLDYVAQSNPGGTRKMFSWDDKYAGAQVLIAKGLLAKKFPVGVVEKLGAYKTTADEFVCNVIQRGSSNTERTPGELLWFQEWNNLQYVTSALFLISSHANSLISSQNNLKCSSGDVSPPNLTRFIKSQVDYILGSNKKNLSYMVGFGPNYPKRVHHKGASIVSITKDPKPVQCSEGFNAWLHTNTENPNILEGAIVGGPDKNDEYMDNRDNYKQFEPAIANNAPIVGVLASMARSSP